MSIFGPVAVGGRARDVVGIGGGVEVKIAAPGAAAVTMAGIAWQR